MIKELNHIGLLTGDMDASRKFYEETLGGIVIRDFINAEGKSQFVYIQLALGVIELIRTAPDATNQGFAHVAFLTDGAKSIEEYHEALVAKGFSFTVAPKTAASGDGKLAFYKDLSGAILELIQRTENIRVRDHKSDTLAAFNHIAIRVSADDARKAGAFYESDMGMRLSDKPAEGMCEYTIGADTIRLDSTMAGDAPLLGICFAVADCAAIRGALVEKGIACAEISGDAFAATGPSGERIVFTRRVGKK